MQGYLDTIDPAQGLTLRLGARHVWVARARLGLHLRLARAAGDLEDAFAAGDVAGAARVMRAYLALSGCEASGATGPELLRACAQIVALNRLQWLTPFMAAPGDVGNGPPPYDYPGRAHAWWVHKLASRYGWTTAEIFDLWPEEAACYLQEIEVAEFDEADERRALSELAYHFDEATGKGTFHPVPRPAWMTGATAAPRVRRIRRDMAPVGNVVDLSGMGVVKDDAIN